MRFARIWTAFLLISMLAAVAMPQRSQAQGDDAATPAPTVLPTPDPGGQDIPVPQANASYRLALLVPFPEDPFWRDVQASALARAATIGLSVDIVALSAPSVPEQLAQIEGAIAAAYDGILLGPVDAIGIAPGISAANAAGIPVLAIDTAPVGGEVITIVRTDNVAAARLAGAFIGAELAGEGTVLNLQGDLANVVAQERDRGLREGLAPHAGIAIESSEGFWQQGNGFVATLEQLPQAEEGTPSPPVPLIEAVFAANPAMTLGAAEAVESVRADAVIVVGFGATEETLDGIQAGTIEAIIAELPARAGILAVDLMVRHLNGESIPSLVDSGFLLLRRGDLETYPFIAS